jgi:hypothetical protein
VLADKRDGVVVDDLEDSTFLGRLVLAVNGKEIEIDARPSDSIALAVGAGAPIFLGKRVVREAGLSEDDILSGRAQKKLGGEDEGQKL